MNLGHEGNAERKSGADDKGLVEFQLCCQPHFQNVRVQIDRSEFSSYPVRGQKTRLKS